MSTPLRVPLTSGSLAAQYPGDVVVYRLLVADADQLIVSRVRPRGTGAELTTSVETADGVALITVAGGIDGARYRLTIGSVWADVRITSQGLVRSSRFDLATQAGVLDVVPTSQGRVIVLSVDGTVAVVDAGTASHQVRHEHTATPITFAADRLVQGWTEFMDLRLAVDGTAFDGTDATVALLLRDRRDQPVYVNGEVTWLTADVVRYAPASQDLQADRSPYRVRLQVTRDGRDLFFPNGEAATWTVRK